VTAIEVGLLTCGSSYSPTPSQPSRDQWLALLAFVPAYSGASVRDLHPLPVSLISIARIAVDFQEVSSGAAHVKSHMTAHKLCSERSAIFAIDGDFKTQTLVTPPELRQAARIFRLNRWLRFRPLGLPFAAIGLIWNIRSAPQGIPRETAVPSCQAGAQA
jgi:hypothetical protein